MAKKLSDQNVWERYVQPALEGNTLPEDAMEVLKGIKPGKFDHQFTRGRRKGIVNYVENAIEHNDTAKLLAIIACYKPAADNALLLAAIKGHKNMAALAIEKGADIHVANGKGHTPLHLAASKGNIDVVALLLEKNADTERRDREGFTPLHEAAMSDNPEVAALLLAKGADIEAETNEKSTPLHYAAYKNSFETAALLLEKGADVGATDHDNETVLDYAAIGNHPDTIKTLLRAGSGIECSIGLITPATTKCFGEIRQHAVTVLKAGPTSANCFTADGKISTAALNACATGQFVTLIGAPLLASDEPEKRALLNEIWNKLPEHWRDHYSAFAIEMIKAKPAIGKYSADALDSRSAPRKKGGRE